MKSSITRSFVTMLIMLTTNTIYAQWYTVNSGGWINSTQNSYLTGITGTSVGDFGIGGAPPILAALHINSSLFAATNTNFTTFGLGQVFATSGPNNTPNTWSMMLGSTATSNGTEFGRIWVDPTALLSFNAQDFILNATDPAGNLEFWTAGATNYSTNLQMIILGNSGTTNGYVGIGNGFAKPNYHVDIVGNYVGDGVNVSDGGLNAVGYSIGGNGNCATCNPGTVLWTSGDATSLYAGYNSGFNTVPLIASAGKFFNTSTGTGALSSFNGSLGSMNTAMGYQCLTNNVADENTGYGYEALYSNGKGIKNVAAGNGALYAAQIVDSSVAVGYQAFYNYNPTTGAQVNSSVGFQSGLNQLSGGQNSYFGAYSGEGPTAGNTGSDNIARNR